MWDVLYGKPGWWRAHHQLFFLAIVAATAGGTCTMIMVPKIAERIMKKEVAPKESYWTLARISGVMFIFYFVFRIYDIYTMATQFVPLADRTYASTLGGYYGWTTLVPELLLALVPVTILNIKKLREQEKLLFIAVICGASAIVFSKIGVVLNGFSVPFFPWRGFATYMPSIQEWLIMFGSIATMILIYMGFAAYLPLFPHLEARAPRVVRTYIECNGRPPGRAASFMR